jgi:hypothetical protein
VRILRGLAQLDVVLNVGSGLVVLLNTGGTFDTLTSSANPSTLGQPVTFTATISASVKDSPGGHPPQEWLCHRNLKGM